ncbi:MAG: dihydrodipicolinate synthase family protein [Pirellulales bacterium]
MITPLVDRDELDVPGLERLIEHLIGGGVSGIFLLGTTGEAPSLGYRLRRELVERACKLAAGRVPVLVGITDTAFVESVALALGAGLRSRRRRADHALLFSRRPNGAARVHREPAAATHAAAGPL